MVTILSFFATNCEKSSQAFNVHVFIMLQGTSASSANHVSLFCYIKFLMQESDCQTLVDNESLPVPDLKEMEISTNGNVVSESRVELTEDESQRHV